MDHCSASSSAPSGDTRTASASVPDLLLELRSALSRIKQLEQVGEQLADSNKILKQIILQLTENPGRPKLRSPISLSLSWLRHTMRCVMQALHGKLRSCWSLCCVAVRLWKNGGGLRRAQKWRGKAVQLWSNAGLMGCLRRGTEKVRHRLDCHLRQRNSTPIARDQPCQQLTCWQSSRILAQLSRYALISLVVPVCKATPRWLDLCIHSVWSQHYPHWELILVDYGAKNYALTELLVSWAARDKRIQILKFENAAEAALAINAGIGMAKGELVGILEQTDQLTPDALTWVVAMHHRHPEAKWFYSDEDKLDEHGCVLEPHHKPDFSLVYLLCWMFTRHLSVYSRYSLTNVGGLRAGFAGSVYHDLALRLTDVIPVGQIVHIPRILYHCHVLSETFSPDAMQDPAEAGKKAVQDALLRRELSGKVVSSPYSVVCQQIHFRPRQSPRVTIIIPTRNMLSSLRACIDSLCAKASYLNYDVIVIDNRSTDPNLSVYLEKMSATGRLRTINYNQPFNHSAMNNAAVEAVASDFVVFMNNDIEILSEAWLEQMLGSADIDQQVAGVGARLLYPDNTIQHGGMVLGLYGTVAHAHKGLPREHPGYYFRSVASGEFIGCTAALLLMRRSAFLEVGGFNAERYPTSYNDADLCLRLRRAGYRCIYNANVEAIHFESKSRSVTVDETELEARRRFVADWGGELFSDPYYNRNLSLNNEQFVGFRPYPLEDDFSFELRTTASKAA